MQKLDFIIIMIDTGDTAWMLIAGCLVLLMILHLVCLNLVY